VSALDLHSMQEWSLQTGSRKSTGSDEPFIDGQKVRSVLCILEGEGLVRLDFNPEEEIRLGNASPIAQWLRTFRSNEAEKELAREAIESADDLFDQMMAQESSNDEAEEQEEIRNVLCFLLALHLERKRVLRPIGRVQANGAQMYRHPKKNCQYEVQAVGLRPELIRSIEKQLDLVLAN